MSDLVTEGERFKPFLVHATTVCAAAVLQHMQTGLFCQGQRHNVVLVNHPPEELSSRVANSTL